MDDFFRKFVFGCTLTGVTISEGAPHKPPSIDLLSKTVSIASYCPTVRKGEQEDVAPPRADVSKTVMNSTALGSETFWGLNFQ
jgi:hypothetical protein